MNRLGRLASVASERRTSGNRVEPQPRPSTHAQPDRAKLGRVFVYERSTNAQLDS